MSAGVAAGRKTGRDVADERGSPVLDTFRAALAASAEQLPATELVPQRLAEAAAAVLPVAGVGMSLYFASGRRLPLGASDPIAATAERLQFTVGEGPCLSAHAAGRPLVADEAELTARWPGYTAELVARTPIRGVIALPLDDGLADVGVLDLYVAPPHRVHDLSVADALVVTREVTRVFQEVNGPGRRARAGLAGRAGRAAPLPGLAGDGVRGHRRCRSAASTPSPCCGPTPTAGAPTWTRSPPRCWTARCRSMPCCPRPTRPDPRLSPGRPRAPGPAARARPGG